MVVTIGHYEASAGLMNSVELFTIPESEIFSLLRL